MATRWTPGPTGVVARPDGPSAAASLAAAIFTIGLTVLALLIAAALLLPPPDAIDGDPITGAASPSLAPSVPAEPGASPAPRPGASAAQASPAPASPAPVGQVDPMPSAAPVTALLRSFAPVRIDGRTAGRVTVQMLRAAMKPDVALTPDERVLVAVIALTATGRLPYAARDWQVEDEDGVRWDALPSSPVDPLGAGTLAPSGTRTGTIAFKLPKDRAVRAVVLTDGDGTDLVVFSREMPAH